ncbi:MAG: hypothetical protein ACK5PG_04500 [Lysobacterales bacterium]
MPLLLRAFVVLVLLLSGALACAQSLVGFPDPSFNGLGFAQGPFLGETERFNSSAENAQGVLVAVGNQGSGSTRCLLARYREGAPAGSGGLSVPGLSPLFCSKVLALPDGRFRVIGSGLQGNGRYTALVIGLTAEGVLDTDFQQQGVRLLEADFSWRGPDEQTLLNSATLDAQGRVLAVGRVINAAEGSNRGLVVRLLEDGSPDPGFAVEGSRPLADYNPPRVLGVSVALDSSGRVHVLGITSIPGVPDVGVLFRLLDDGAIDTGFGIGMDAPLRTGGGGRGFVRQCYRVGGLLLDAEDRMLLGCQPDFSGATPGPILEPGVLRLVASGQPDTSYSGDGYLELVPAGAPGSLLQAPRLALAANGELVVGSTLWRGSSNADPQDILVARLRADGTFTSFGLGGGHESHYTVDLWRSSDGRNDELGELRLDARDRVVLTGSQLDPLSAGATSTALIARLGMADPERHAGFLDPEHSTRVLRIDEVSGPRRSTITEGLRIDAQGRALIAGTLYLETSPVSAVCGVSRLLPDGQPDASFAGNGERGLSLVAGGETYCNAVEPLSAGGLLLAGSRGGAAAGGVVIKLREDGSIDTGFWGDGVLDSGSELGLNARQIRVRFSAVRQDPQGRIVLLGNGVATGPQDPQLRCGFDQPNDECAVLVRLRADGSLDTGFGNGGLQVLVSPTNPSRLRANGLAFDQAGRLLVAGSDGSTTFDESAVLFDVAEDGQGPRNAIRLRSSTGCRFAGNALAVDAGNARLLGCSLSVGSGVLRLLPNNAPDLDFGLAGVVAIDFDPSSGGDSASIAAVLPQWDASVIVVGTHTQGAPWAAAFGGADLAVTKLDPAGNRVGYPDFGADTGTRLRFPDRPGAYDEYPAAAVQQADGRFLIAGTLADARPGVPQQDNTRMFLTRLGNPQPVPLLPEIFRDGFE